MPTKITLRINGKESHLSADTWQKNGGMDGYAKDYGDALQVRVKAKDGSTGFIPVTDWGNAKGQGYQVLTTYYGEPKTRQTPYGVVDQPLNNGERGAQGIPDDAQPISPVQPHNPQQVAPVQAKSPSLQPSLTPDQQARLSQQMTRFKRWLHMDNVTPDTSKATSLIDAANKNLFGRIKEEEAQRSKPYGAAYSVDSTGDVVENKPAERYLLRTQGQQEDMVNESLQGISDRYGKGVADKAIGIGNKKATNEALQSANDRIHGISPVAGDTNGLQQWSGVANANRHTDPKAILSDATNILKGTFNSKQFIDNARAEAKRIGMDEQEYIKAAKENTSEQVKKDIYTKLIQSEMPRNHIDYIMKGLSNSIAGLVVGGINKTKGQREVAAIASQMTEQGQNPSFTPNFWDKLGSVSASFVADAPFFGISGELSGQAIKGIAERQLTRLTATGMSKGAAQRVIASKMRSSFGARMADMVGKGAIGGGINLGAYNALHETARQLADQDINPESLAKETAKGIVTGAVLGVGGGLTNAATYELSGLPKVLGKVGGFGTEGLIFTATGRALDGSDKSWVDDLASSYAQLAVMKLTSNPAKTLDNIANFRKAFDHSAGERSGGLKFTQEEQNEIKQSTGGNGLVKSLTGAEAYVSRWRDREAKADAGKEGKGLVTLEKGERLKGEDEMIRKNLSDNYENLMRDKNISYSTKQKVRYLLGGKMDIYVPLASGYTTDSDGKTFTVTTNDKDGNRIERRTFKSEQEANDYTDKLKEAIDKDAKSEKDYSAALAAYNDLIAQDGASEADIKKVIRGETTGDEQKDYAIKSRYTKLFNEYAKQQPQPTRNTGQPQENQGRIEAESVQPTEQPIGAQSKVPQNVEGNNDGLLKEQEAKGSDTEQTTLEETQANSYQKGYDAPDEQKNDVKRTYEKAQTRLASMLPDNMEEIENNPMDFVRDNPKFPTLSEEQKNAVYDYVQAKTSFDGMVHHVQDEMDARVSASDKEVDGRVSQVDGAIHPISLKTIDDNGHDKKAYIINGNVQMLPDGTMVDTEKSDKTIVIRDAVTGEVSMIDPREILSMDEPIDAEQEKRTAADAIRQAYSKQEADKIDGVLPFAPGDTYAVVDGQGQPHNVSIVGDAVDEGTGQPIEGAVLATVDGQQAILPKDQIQAMSDAAKDATEVKRDSIPYPFELNDEFVITTTDGRDVRGTITAGADSDGNVQIATEEPVNGQMVSVVSPDELSRSIKEYNGMTATQQEEAQPAEQSVVDSAPIKDISAETSQDIVPQPDNAMQDAEVDPTVVTQQDVAKDELPRDDDGNLVYDKVPVQKTIEDLYDGSLDDNEIKDFVDTNIKESDKAYKVLEKKAPKMGANKAKYLAAKKEWQSNLDEAKRKADYWKEVHAEQQRITNTTPDQVQEAQDELSGKNAVDELNANKEQVTFTSPLDMATQFVRGAKITPESFQKETGLTTAGQGKYVGMISNVGKSIERLGEELATMDDDENGGAFFHGDSNEARSAIIEALGEIRGKGGKKAQDMAEQDAAIAAYAQQRDNVFHENYGMGYEDYLAFEERFLPDMLRKYSNFDEDDYNNTYADEIAAQLKQDESYGREPITEGEQPGNDTSVEVLQGSPSDDTGGVAVPGDEGRQVETGSNSDAQDGTVSEEPRGEVNHEAEKFTPSSKKDGEDLFGYAERVIDEHKRKKEEENVDTNPSEAQKEAAQPQVGTPSLNLNGDHRPVLDTGLAPVMYEVTDWENIQPVITSGEAQKISPEDVADLIIANMDKSPYPKSMALQLAKINANNRPLFNDWVHNTFDGWLNGILDNAPDVYEMIRPIFDDDVQMQKSVRAVGKKLWKLAQETTTPELTEETVAADGYTVEPAKYTTKRGKVLDMQLVKFDRELTKEEQRNARELAKSLKGWYDREQGGFMMRSAEDAQQIVDAIMEESGETLADAAPLSLQDVKKATGVEPKKVNINGEKKKMSIPEFSEAMRNGRWEEQSKAEDNHKLVSTARYEELKKRMRDKLNSLNMGIDPEILAMGTEMAVYHIEGGARKFAKYAKNMIADMGDAIRPYLKSFYNAVRDMPEADEFVGDMDAYDDVRKFDVANFDKQSSDVLAQAEQTANEVSIEAKAKTVKEEITNKRNNERRKENEQTAANTETVAGQAETVASTAETYNDVNAARPNEKEYNEVIDKIDDELDKVNTQLGLLGFYKADEVESDFNEQYGYMKNAEKKAVADADKWAKRLAAALGIPLSKGKKRLSKANIAPAGGDITIRIPLAAGKELVIMLDMDTNFSGGRFSDDLTLRDGVMYRIEDSMINGSARFVSKNNWIDTTETFDKAVKDMSWLIKRYAPEFTPVEVKQPKEKNPTSKKSDTKAGTKAKPEVKQPSMFDFFDKQVTDEIAKENEETEEKTENNQEKTPDNEENSVSSQSEEKPVTEVTNTDTIGDSEQYQQRKHEEDAFVQRIGTEIEDAYDWDDKPLTMTDIKQMVKDYPHLADLSDTDLQEMVELAMSNLTRRVAQDAIGKGEKEEREAYDKIVGLYNAQPQLNARDSTRVELQQYSTPTPFAFLMGQFASRDHEVKNAFDPTAGNGALTICFDPKICDVNEIDDRRLANLRHQNFGKVTSQDGLQPFAPKAVDTVLTNPPFGTTTMRSFDGGTYDITSLEGQIVINALDHMKDDGRAAIIIGGNNSYRSNGSLNPKDAQFLGYLYTHYNVVDVINVDGKLYGRNGTKYPVRMILIKGRRNAYKDGVLQRVYPPVQKNARAEQVTTFDELYKRIQDDILSAKQLRLEPVDDVQGQSGLADNPRQPVQHSESDSGTGSRPVGGSSNAGPRHTPGTRTTGGHAGSGVAATDTKPAGGAKPSTPAANRPANGTTAPASSSSSVHGNESNGSSQPVGGRTDRPDSNAGRPASSRERLKPVALTAEKVHYPNQSQSMTLNSMVPANQAEAIADNLEKLGDADQFLVDELGYSSKEELYSHLASEQIDSVALAIHQMKQGKAFIIGDMTGIGKGRQGAALIRWDVKQGKTPIYLTQKPTLFSDNYRDLVDIGSDDLVPFIMGSKNQNSDPNITDAQGNIVHSVLPDAAKKAAYEQIRDTGKLPEGYDFLITSYSQLQNGTKDFEVGQNGEITQKDKKKGGAGAIAGQLRRDAFERLAQGNIIIMDESHTVGGSGNTGLFMQTVIPKAAGATFMSATFAKRADNMPIYALKTDLSESGIKQGDLIDAVNKGGVTLQELMSKQLVESGQMIRRERDFTGVTIDWLSTSNDEASDKADQEKFDVCAEIFNDIRQFQDDYVTPVIEDMSEGAAETGGTVGHKQGTKDMGVNNAPFASKMFNLVNQLLLSMKVNAVVDRALVNLKKGEKPIITFSNTMEGFLEEAPQGVPLDKVPSFSVTLKHALDGVMRWTKKDEKGGTVESGYVPLSKLSPEGQQKYKDIAEKIRSMSVDLPISPMDAIKMRLQQAGYKVGEITGRKLELNATEDGKYIIEPRKGRDKKAVARDFNSGDLDVLLINKSGSTGISLHASSKFKDQKPRVMIAAQFQSDINDEVQMRGRNDRTGQVHRGRYEYLVSSIPAEQRLQMMFKQKLKSLDANTTSSQKSKFNEMDIVDFLNKYGDRIAYDYMVEHPEIEELLGDPLGLLLDESKKNDNSRGRDDDSDSNPATDAASKVCRRLAFLPVADQRKVLNDISAAYQTKIDMLNESGQNDLVITTMPLRAKTVRKQIWQKGTNPNSGNAFADNTYLEQCEVDVLKKPMRAEEIRKMMSKMRDGKSWEDWKEQTLAAMRKHFDDYKADTKAKMDEDAKKKAQKAHDKYVKDTQKFREQGKNTYTDEEIEHMAQLAAKEKMDQENERIENRLKTIEGRFTDMKHAMFLEPGKVVIVPDMSSNTLGLEGTPAIFLGYSISKDFSISSSTRTFATLDGRRTVRLPLNDKEGYSRIFNATRQQDALAESVTLDNWDSKAPTQTRKTSYIVTGNLLKAIVDTQKNDKTHGRLITFSDINGNTRQGILLPDKFEEQDLVVDHPISTQFEGLVRLDLPYVESSDGRVRIEYDNWRGFKISVPKSTKQGGEYFLDRQLRSIIGGEFTTKGNKMVAWVDNPSDLKRLFTRLTNMAVTVKGKANLKDVKMPKIEENANTPTPEQREIGNALIDSIRKCGVTVHTDVKEMEDALSNLGIQFLHTKDGNVYGFVKDGEIYLDNALLDTNSPVHEYTHLWDSALQKTNPELWNRGKELMSQLPVWNEVLNDENYKDIKDNEDLVASEVHSRLSGAESERLFDEGINDSKKDGVFAEAEARTLIARIKNWLNDVWKWVKDTFTPWTKEEADKVPLKDFINMPIRDLLNGKKMPPVMGEKATIDKNDDLQYLIKEESSTGKPVSIDRVSVRGDYEKQIASGLYQFQEAMQDSMLGLKTLMMDIWKANGKEGHVFDIPGYENPYLLENAMSSANQAQAEIYGKMIIKPLIKAIAAFEGNGYKQEDVTDYMLAKHGLERNDYMRRKTAEEKLSESDYAKEIRKQERYLRTPEGKDDEEAKEKLANMKDQFDEMVIETMQGDDHDYSGITSLTKESDVWAAEEIARKMVNDFESNAGEEMTNNLWERTNDATKATLRKLYDSGLMTKANYEKVRDMYKNYVPLRGWDETTTEDVYTYMNHRDGAMRGSIMKKAEGRRSKADDPIATIEAMAEAGISQGNRNLMKQAFLNFVQNHPSDLVSVDDIWLKYNDVTEEWETVFPQLSNDDTAEDVRNKVEAFNQRMVELSNDNPEKYKRGKDDVNIPYVVVPGTQSEHEILVRRGGRPYVMVINGNPRAAQAVNGLTNPDVEVGGAWGNILKGMEKVNRFISAMVTTRFPDFVASNFVRDAEYSNAMSWVKESPNYAARFGVNFAKNNPAMIGYLLNKFKKGDLDINDETQKMFQDFMMNGGETGYTIVRDIEAHKKKIHEEIRKANGKLPVKRAWQLLGEKFDDVNRSVENCARFNAFLTSRQFGRSVERAIWDAKEVSVNFNKKGAGARFLGTKGMTTLGNTGAFMSGVGRTGFIFWNAGVQGLYNSGGTTLRNPKKALSLMASLFLLGSIIPSLSGDGGDDDKNNYYNLPSAIRRTSICFRVGDVWLSIPLAIEYRALYGLGELATSVMSGNEKHDDKELVAETMKQLTQIMPLDFMEGGGGFGTLVPSSVKPIYESINNEDWTGLPLYKETPYNTNKPDWTKAYKNANKELVDIAKGVSRATGGNDAKKGAVDVNPAEVENVLEGYLGGAARTVNMLVKSGETMFANRDFEWRNVPIANRFIKGTDERTQLKAVKDRYYNYLDEFNETKRLEREYKNRADKGVLEYAEELNFLYNSKEYLRMTITEDFVKEIGKLNEQKNNADDDNERKAIESEQDMLMTEVVNILQQQEENK